MSQQQQKLGGGLLLKNRFKNKPTHPDYTGNEVNFCCPQCQKEFQIAVAAWNKTGKNGGQFFSLALSTPYVKDAGDMPRDGQQAPKSDTAPSSESNEPRQPDDDVPF